MLERGLRPSVCAEQRGDGDRNRGVPGKETFVRLASELSLGCVVVGVEAELREKVCCRPQVYSKHCTDILYATMPMNLTYQGWVSQNEVPRVRAQGRMLRGLEAQSRSGNINS